MVVTSLPPKYGLNAMVGIEHHTVPVEEVIEVVADKLWTSWNQPIVALDSRCGLDPRKYRVADFNRLLMDSDTKTLVDSYTEGASPAWKRMEMDFLAIAQVEL